MAGATQALNLPASTSSVHTVRPAGAAVLFAVDSRDTTTAGGFLKGSGNGTQVQVKPLLSTFPSEASAAEPLFHRGVAGSSSFELGPPALLAGGGVSSKLPDENISSVALSTSCCLMVCTTLAPGPIPVMTTGGGGAPVHL